MWESISRIGHSVSNIVQELEQQQQEDEDEEGWDWKLEQGEQKENDILKDKVQAAAKVQVIL